MHVAESTHWYDRTGKPAYTVLAKAGHERPTTLADARKLSLVPSVTTIIKCAAAPGLEKWKRDQMMLAALTLPRDQDEPEGEWLSRVEHDSKETARKAAEKGTAIHAAIQGHIDGETQSGFEPYIEAACKALNEWHRDWAWEAERSFACEMGFGGKVDVSHHAAALVADFKTKEFSDTDKLKTWDEHAMQLAAYRHGLGVPKANCAIVYVSTTNPGLAKLIEIPQKDLSDGWEMFCGLLSYWKAKNGFEPGWIKEAA